jgi:transcriptional regulator NrdR family protein
MAHSNRGLECPRCGCRHFETTHTQPMNDGRIRRRKRCRHCQYRIVTYEGTVTTLRKHLSDTGSTHS